MCTKRNKASTTKYWQNLFKCQRDPLESKYQLLINRKEEVGIKEIKKYKSIH